MKSSRFLKNNGPLKFQRFKNGTIPQDIFASCLGAIAALIVLLGIGTLVVAQLATQADQPKPVKPNSVLHLKLDNPVPEMTNNLEMNPFDLGNQKILGLHDILRLLEKAKEDDNIQGILLETDALAVSGLPTTGALREGLIDFKESGKFVIAYSKYYTQGAYYLASVSDKIYLNPIGLVDFRGFAAQVPFMKEMFDKVGVKWQVFYAGKYKSATEPYRRTEMSDEYKEQVREYLDQMYALFLEDVSLARNMEVSRLRDIADAYLAADPQRAMEYGMVDVVGYRDEALADVRERMGLATDEKISLVSLKDYYRNNPLTKDYSVKDKVAVIYAEGTIVDGEGEPGSVGDQKYTKIIKEVSDDENIRAVVLRVNSPGGSAMASENIWRALTQLKEESGKPLVVSFGDYAASGGYYFACVGDSILSEPNTLTGSIGVFSMIPNAQELLNDKLGIRFDTVKTGNFSTGITPFYEMSEEEKTVLQRRTDDLYQIFKSRVANGRNMPLERVDEIAQGRVWTGEKALEIGLVDQLGNLEEALEIAAGMAQLDDYRISEFPKVKDPIQQLIEEVTGQDEAHIERAIKSELSDWYPYYRYVSEVRKTKGVQARLPFIVPFK